MILRLLCSLLSFIILLTPMGCDEPSVVGDPFITEITFFEKKFDLPELVNESSGLIHFNNQVITHNDSGDTTYLYLIESTTGLLDETKLIENIDHRDWEALTQNESSIFIGDFGNNAGNRSDLKVYQIDKTTFDVTDTLSFAYANQVDFDPENEQHNFNMEAMIWCQDRLFLFSKSHLNLKTYLYELYPLIDSVQVPSPIDSFDVNALVTDAAYWEETQQLALIGYDNAQDLNTYVYLFDNFNPINLFYSTPRSLALDINEQIEGCTYVDENTLWITSEKETNFGGNLYELVFD